MKWIIYTLILLSLAIDVAAKSKKVVRVGWYESAYNSTDRFGHRSGYAYEYQQKIAAYTGWKYEYVEGNWVTLLEKLQNGEIDLLSDVSYTPERAKNMLFSTQPMGCEEYYILIDNANTAINPEDITTLNGKKVGINAGSIQEGIYEKWAKDNGIKAQVVEIDGQERDFAEYMLNGELDAVVSVSAIDHNLNHCIPVTVIGASDFYFVINKNRQDLKADLDNAMKQILHNNMYYNRLLYEKYMVNSGSFRSLSGREVEWIRHHGAIRVGYRDKYLPFCGTNKNTGEVDGFLKDFTSVSSNVVRNADIRFETTPYPNTDALINALKNKEIDCIFPISLDLYEAEEMGVLLTDPVMEIEELLVVKKSDVEDFDISEPKRIAVNGKNMSHASVVREQYPDWELVSFNTPEECVQAVADGKADCMLVSNYRYGVMHRQFEHYGLVTISTGITMNHMFAVLPDDFCLYSILGRLTNMMSSAEIHSSLTKHTQTDSQMTMSDFIRENIGYIVLFFAVIIAIISVLFVKSLSSMKKTKQLNSELKTHQKQLSEAYEDQKDHLEEISLLNTELEWAKTQAEAASSAKTSFLFNMSHDIRTPMNAIMGFRDLLEKHIDEPERRADYLRKIKDASKVLLSIINNVLEMARIEKGTVVVEEVAMNTKNFGVSIFSVFSEMMAEKNIEFTHEDLVVHHNVYCDPTKVREIFMNLLSNAYKYTKPGGKVHVRLRELPSNREGYGIFETSVSDTGVGMSAEYLSHIFEEFSRENTSTANKIEGTGLGMPIVKRLVELMNGTIRVSSKKGVGTTFVVTLPHRIADEMESVEVENVEADEAVFEGKRILLAEDNDLNAEIAEEILTSAGFMIERAEDGAICYEKIVSSETGYYDLVLMDIQMPNMDGYQATRAIRALADKEKANLPIIAMTANAFEEDKSKAVNMGMNGHIAKPIDVSELFKVLARVLVHK
jgi:signal transduction histidine kinase/ABC-type amino acid transport substrate-binding protein/ActR/RegA family two-component response regulator